MVARKKPPTKAVKVHKPKWRRDLWSFLSLLQSFAAAFVAIGVVIGGFTAAFAYFQWRVLPWATGPEIAEMIKVANKPLSDQLNGVVGWINHEQCVDYNDRFVRAQKALLRNPSDMVATDMWKAANDKIMSIPDCKPQLIAPVSGVLPDPTF